MAEQTTRDPKSPPEWFIRVAWRVHRGLHRFSGGRFLWTPSNKRGWGTMRLTTVGRRSGQARAVILGYLEDGSDLFTLAMNGWMEGHPAWWLNLQAEPDAVVHLSDGEERPVRARVATDEERERFLARWRVAMPDLDAQAGARTTETPVVVFEPRPAS